jgi:hypothetical protein
VTATLPASGSASRCKLGQTSAYAVVYGGGVPICFAGGRRSFTGGVRLVRLALETDTYPSRCLVLVARCSDVNRADFPRS